MKHLFVILGFLLVFLGVSAQETDRYDNLLTEGNSFYEAGSYDSALLRYSQVVNAGHEGFELFYNAGNASYKAGQLASAIYYYEKALKLKPSDDDTRFNLSLAEAQIIDKITPIDEAFVMVLWQNIVDLVSLELWTIIFLIFCLISPVMFSIYLFADKTLLRRIGFFSALLFTFTAFLVFFAARSSYNKLMYDSHAIVFSPTLEVRAEPRAASSNLFVIHEGTKVKLLESGDGWKRIALPNGNEGWVPEDEILTY